MSLSASGAERESLTEDLRGMANDLAAALFSSVLERAEKRGFEQALQNEHARASALEERARNAEQGPDSPALLAFKRERDEAREKLEGKTIAYEWLMDQHGLRVKAIEGLRAERDALTVKLRAVQGEPDHADETGNKARASLDNLHEVIAGLRKENEKLSQDESSLSSTLQAIVSELSRVTSGGVSLKTPGEAVEFARRLVALAGPAPEAETKS